MMVIFIIIYTENWVSGGPLGGYECNDSNSNSKHSFLDEPTAM